MMQVKLPPPRPCTIAARAARGGGRLVQMPPFVETLLLLAGTALALAFRPWATLRAPALRHPWLGALVVLPLLWALPARLPGGLPLSPSMAALLVLMFGWPLAVVTVVPAALASAVLALGLGAATLPLAVHTAVWQGLLPASLALLAGLATRRWLPQHLMVYILARAFGGTLLAMSATGGLAVLLLPAPPGTDLATLLTGRWLMAWGDAVATGMAAAVFVAFRPEWLATYSDRRYLPR